MNASRVIVASTVAAAFSLAVSALVQAGPAPMPKFEHEKCYGVSKAGKNDCETKNSSCAGTSKRNAQGDAWIYVPKGTCEKVVNGSMQPKA
jgi:uncharacterized membrane protein